MNKHNYDHAIRTLHKLRDGYKSQLDTCIATELDAVIAELENSSNDNQVRISQDLCIRVLRVIGVAASIINNLKDLIP